LLAVGLFNGPSQATLVRPAGAAESSPAELYVDWVYRSLLFRRPDPGARDYWAAMVDSGRRADFVQFVASSDEWQAVWIGLSYQRWLGRAADPSGLAFWSSFLDSGQWFVEFEAQLGGSGEAFEIGSQGPGQEPLANYVRYVFDIGADVAPTEEEVDELTGLVGPFPQTELLYSALFGQEGVDQRVVVAYVRTLDRMPDPAGSSYWGIQYGTSGSISKLLVGTLLSDEAWALAQDPPSPGG
jgi:hypothetical protein